MGGGGGGGLRREAVQQLIVVSCEQCRNIFENPISTGQEALSCTVYHLLSKREHWKFKGHQLVRLARMS